MTDLPKDDAPAAQGGPDTASARIPDPATEAWAPATDAGQEAAAAPRSAKEPARSSSRGKGTGRAAPAGDDTLRRRPDQAEGQDAAGEPPAAPATPPGERIAKAIARAGIASRRDAEAMILAGRVSVNGAVLDSPALNVTEADRILVDGEPLPERERSRLWIFHKPRGLVTTARDPEGRQTVFDVLPEDMPRVVAVGRLDINTEGLLLLTNDGGLAKVIAHPDTGWLRRYRVRAHGDTDQAQLDRLRRGVTIDGMEYGPVEATLDRVQGDNLWLTLGLREGKNREVKRILEHLGLQVNRLIRLSFGPFQLGDLEVGLVDEVRTRVLKDQLGKTLSEQAGVDFESPVREPITPFGAAAGRPAAGAPDKARAPERPRRDAARPPAQRVSTGGSGSGPQRSVWRADESGPTGRPGRAPRRGADPRVDQDAAAERGRERVGSFRKGERRVVVERFSARPPEPQPEEKPRRRFGKGFGHAGGQASGDGGERAGGRGQDTRARHAGGDRPGGRPTEGRGERGARERSAAHEGGRSRAPGRPRDDSGQAAGRGGDGKPAARRAGPAPAGRGFQEGAPRDRKAGGGKPSFGGGKPGSGGHRGGGRPAGKPQGAGGRGGPRPGGGRPPRGAR